MKTVFFVDGFNVYHALNKNRSYHKYKWLHLKQLALNLIDTEDDLQKVLYFTAYCTWDAQKKQRHKTYVEALTKFGVQIIKGKFQPVTKKFSNHMQIKSIQPTHHPVPRSIEYITNEEKRADVNIAMKIIDYAYQDYYDHAYILSADSDIAPAIELAKQRFPEKKFTIVLPIDSKGGYICKIADRNITLRERDLQNAQLPESIAINVTRTIHRPSTWN